MALPRAIRHIPFGRVLLAGEILVLAQQHITRLTPEERRRVIALTARTRGRRRNLTEQERNELAALVAKANPRLFAGTVAQRLSPVPLPRRVVEGRRRAKR